MNGCVIEGISAELSLNRLWFSPEAHLLNLLKKLRGGVKKAAGPHALSSVVKS